VMSLSWFFFPLKNRKQSYIYQIFKITENLAKIAFSMLTSQTPKLQIMSLAAGIIYGLSGFSLYKRKRNLFFLSS